MKKFNDYESTEVYTEGYGKLPVGGYVCEIKKANVVGTPEDNVYQMHLLVDVSEGDQKSFFENQYKANTNEDKKWKGTVRIWLPKDDGSEKDGWSKRSFKTIMTAIEQSNSGYSWNWDEDTLKGKKIGLVATEAIEIIGGKEVEFIEFLPRNVHSVEDIKSGNFKITDKRIGKGVNPSAPSGNDNFVPVDKSIEEELPF